MSAAPPSPLRVTRSSWDGYWLWQYTNHQQLTLIPNTLAGIPGDADGNLDGDAYDGTGNSSWTSGLHDGRGYLPGYARSRLSSFRRSTARKLERTHETGDRLPIHPQRERRPPVPVAVYITSATVVLEKPTFEVKQQPLQLSLSSSALPRAGRRVRTTRRNCTTGHPLAPPPS